jgi:hypothetical protein
MQYRVSCAYMVMAGDLAHSPSQTAVARPQAWCQSTAQHLPQAQQVELEVKVNEQAAACAGVASDDQLLLHSGGATRLEASLQK